MQKKGGGNNNTLDTFVYIFLLGNKSDHYQRENIQSAERNSSQHVVMFVKIPSNPPMYADCERSYCSDT